MQSQQQWEGNRETATVHNRRNLSDIANTTKKCGAMVGY